MAVQPAAGFFTLGVADLLHSPNDRSLSVTIMLGTPEFRIVFFKNLTPPSDTASLRQRIPTPSLHDSQRAWVVHLSIDLHKSFVQIPLPIGVGAYLLDAFPADFFREHRAKPFLPKQDSFIADVGTPLIADILDIPNPKRKENAELHG